MAAKTLETSLQPGSLATFQSLFYSKDDRSRVGAETSTNEAKTSADDPGGWRKKFAAKMQQMGGVSGVRDPELLADLKHRLAMRDLDFGETRFSGWVTTGEDGSSRIDLVVRCKQPSIIYRFFLDDFVDVPIRLYCTDTQLRSEIPYRKAFDMLGCLVTVALFAAFIVPGIIWLYFTRSARKVWDVVHEEVVFTALEERLRRNVA